MSCNSTNPCSSSCPTTCGCVVQVPGTCVFYQGSNLTCLDVTKGDNYDDILSNINNIVCDLLPPTGSNTYIGETGQITVINNVIGLDPAITTLLNTHTTNITNLQTCVSNGVRNITTTPGSGLTVTFSPQTTCGRTATINYTAPAIPLSQKQGIIDNITENTSTASLVYTYDLTPYDLKVGDVLKIKGDVLINALTTDPDCLDKLIILTDNITNIPFTLLTRGDNYCKQYEYILSDFEFILSVTAVTSTNISFKTYYKNSRFVNIPPSTGAADGEFRMINPPDFRMYQKSSGTSFLKNQFKFTIVGNANTTLRQYIVEIIRKIN